MISPYSPLKYLLAPMLILTGLINGMIPPAYLSQSSKSASADTGSRPNPEIELKHPRSPVSTPRPDGANQIAQTQALTDYGRLPMSFEVNRGQIDQQVKFFSRGSGYNLLLTSNEAVLSLHRNLTSKIGRSKNSSMPAAARHRAQSSPSPLRMRLVGASLAPQIDGADQLPGKSNYLIGTDPDKWRTNIPQYARVQYRNVYPGVDMVYRGNQRQLEYDFIVAPGANPDDIKLSFNGMERMRVDVQGDLVLAIAGGEIRQHRPFVFQMSNGSKKEIPGRYVIKGRSQVGFQVAAYDVTRPLIIDPILSYSTYLGGSGNDRGTGIAIDAAGNAYVTGFTESFNFPTANALKPSHALDNNKDAFVTKLNAAGTALVYSTYLGGNGLDSGNGIAVDSEGYAYVTGATNSNNFPTTPGAFQTTANPSDAFVVKLNPTGSALVYSTRLGGTFGAAGASIAIDSAGNAYVAGDTPSSDFPIVNGFQNTSVSFNQTVFMAKLNSTGSSLLYSTYIGVGAAHGIAIDAAGNAYVTGDAISNNPFSSFPTTPGAFQTAYRGFTDAFITRIDPSQLGAASLVYSTFLGSNGNDFGNAIAVDSDGNAYVTGRTGSGSGPTIFPTTAGAFQSTVPNVGDAFVTKLNPAGSNLVYSTTLGGRGEDVGNGIAVDTAGNAYVVGTSGSCDFPRHNNNLLICPAVDGVFVVKLNPAGADVVYSARLGSKSGLADVGTAIALDTGGNLYITGRTDSPNFTVLPGAPQTTFGGFADAFVAKIVGSDTPVGSNVIVQSGAVTVVFTNVSVGGNTTATAIDPNLAGTLPSGFVPLDNFAFDITTTATVTGPITISFKVLSITDPTVFASLHIFHGENGLLVDRTVSSDFATRTISAAVSSLSPFVIAQAVDVNNSPAARCKDITIPAGNSCAATITAGDVDNGSFDPDSGDSVTLSLDSTGPFGLGSHTVQLIATDGHGASSSCNATVTVVDVTAPTITNCASDKTISAGANCQASVPDLTSEIAATDNCSTSMSITQSPAAGAIVGPGNTEVTITVKDAAGNSATCRATVMVIDAKPPEISDGASASPSTLWPPNKKMALVTINYSVTDNCDSSPVCTLSVTSNEGGSADWQILDAHHVLLRAERAVGGEGRIYSIKITCTDENNNSSSKVVTVTVPHDQR
jgi:hypothetical protein